MSPFDRAMKELTETALRVKNERDELLKALEVLLEEASYLDSSQHMNRGTGAYEEADAIISARAVIAKVKGS